MKPVHLYNQGNINIYRSDRKQCFFKLDVYVHIYMGRNPEKLGKVYYEGQTVHVVNTPAKHHILRRIIDYNNLKMITYSDRV